MPSLLGERSSCFFESEDFLRPKRSFSESPRNRGPKLSKSLINRPPKVNRLVPFGGREGPFVRSMFLFARQQTWPMGKLPDYRLRTT
jgi:hypothetical protein